jgi:Rod binding domain-containing protein
MVQPIGDDATTNEKSSLIRWWHNQWETLFYKVMVQSMRSLLIKMMEQPMGDLV